MTSELPAVQTKTPQTLSEVCEQLRDQLRATGFGIEDRERGQGLREVVLRTKVDTLARSKVAIEDGADAISLLTHDLTIRFSKERFLARTRVEGKWLEIALSEGEPGALFESLIKHQRLLDALRRTLAHLVEASKRPLQAVFLTRALNAIMALSRDAQDKSLADASSAASDYRVLVRALEDPGAAEKLRQEDPLSPSRLRGIEAKLRLLEAEGGTLSADEVAKILRITRQAVDKRRRSGRLIAIRHGRRGYAYPAWQFGDRGTVPGLEEVLADLKAHDPWMQLAFMVNANTRLDGKTPLSQLREGNLTVVREAAKAYGEHGAA